MNISELKPGLRLEFNPASDSEQINEYSYVSQLVDIIDGENIVIAAPIRNSRVIFVPSNIKIKVMFLHKVHGLMAFTGTITGKSQKGNLSVLNIKVESQIQKHQRRKYFRLDCFIDVSYRIYENYSEEGPNDNIVKSEPCKAMTKNLSGSGTCIVTDDDIPKGTYVEVSLALDSKTHLNVICRVMRNVLMEHPRSPKHEIGLHFVNLSEKDHDAIIKYIFDQQRLLIKKDIL